MAEANGGRGHEKGRINSVARPRLTLPSLQTHGHDWTSLRWYCTALSYLRCIAEHITESHLSAYLRPGITLKLKLKSRGTHPNYDYSERSVPPRGWRMRQEVHRTAMAELVIGQASDWEEALLGWRNKQGVQKGE